MNYLSRHLARLQIEDRVIAVEHRDGSVSLNLLDRNGEDVDSATLTRSEATRFRAWLATREPVNTTVGAVWSQAERIVSRSGRHSRARTWRDIPQPGGIRRRVASTLRRLWLAVIR